MCPFSIVLLNVQQEEFTEWKRKKKAKNKQQPHNKEVFWGIILSCIISAETEVKLLTEVDSYISRLSAPAFFTFYLILRHSPAVQCPCDVHAALCKQIEDVLWQELIVSHLYHIAWTDTRRSGMNREMGTHLLLRNQEQNHARDTSMHHKTM